LKSFCLNRSKQLNPKQEKKCIKQQAKSSLCAGKRGDDRALCAVSEVYPSCWVHQDCHVADEQKAALKKAAGVSKGKDECQVRLKWREHDYWMGTEIGMLGGYGFQAQVTPGDSSDKGKMGEGCNNLRSKNEIQQGKVEHKEDGSKSNRPLSLALRDTLIQELILYSCNSKSLLKAVNSVSEFVSDAVCARVPL